MLAAAGPDRALAIERFIVDRAVEAGDVGPLIGSRLGPWRLVGVLGRGGMGTVYRAERADGHYRQEVAVKILGSGPCDPYAIDRFRTERQVLAHLTHPNIAGLLDGGFAPDGTPYLVMELVDGVPISEWCAAQRLPLEARLRLFRVVCDAVQHAHRALVVHRDLKPSNIFVSQSGIVKLLDFGIAKLLDPGAWDVGSVATRADLRLITPEYAAPEQRRDGHITTATDVYALGVVLYELLTGLRPRELTGSTRSSHPQDLVPSPVIAPSEVVRRFTSNRSTLERTRESTATDVTWSVADRRRLFRRIRGDLDRIVLNALREEPERRYASAGQLGEEIERFLAGRAVLAQPDTVGYRARKFVGRNRLAVTAAAVFISCIVAFGARRDSAGTSTCRAEPRRQARARQSGAGGAGSRRLVRDHQSSRPPRRRSDDCSRVPDRRGGPRSCAVARHSRGESEAEGRSSASSTTNAASSRWRATLSRKRWQSSDAWVGPIVRTRSSLCTRSGESCTTQATNRGPAVFSRSLSTVIVMSMATSTRRPRERCLPLLLSPQVRISKRARDCSRKRLKSGGGCWRRITPTLP